MSPVDPPHPHSYGMERPETSTSVRQMSESNWAGNYTYQADIVHRPSRIDQVQEIIANARRIGVLGSRHSFSDIADSSELVTLDELPAEILVDHGAGTVTFSGGVRYGELAEIC